MPGPYVERGERITLRTVEREDAAFIQRGYTHPEIRLPLGNLTHKNQEQIEDHYENIIENDSHLNFLVCIDEDDTDPGHSGENDVTPIGLIAVTGVDWRRPGLVYWLIPEYHGKGYGKESVSLIVDYVFRMFDTPGIAAEAYDFNEASRGLLESIGFSEEGRLRKDRFIEGEYRDRLQYGLLRSEWEEQNEA